MEFLADVPLPEVRRTTVLVVHPIARGRARCFVADARNVREDCFEVVGGSGIFASDAFPEDTFYAAIAHVLQHFPVRILSILFAVRVPTALQGAARHIIARHLGVESRPQLLAGALDFLFRVCDHCFKALGRDRVSGVGVEVFRMPIFCRRVHAHVTEVDVIACCLEGVRRPRTDPKRHTGFACPLPNHVRNPGKKH